MNFKRSNKRSVNIPFDGFYYTLHDDAFTQALEMIFSDSSGNALGGKMADAWEYVDWKKAHTSYAKEFGIDLCAHLEIKGAEFEEMVSPREYNFETDRIFMLIPDRELRRMRRETPVELLDKVAKERHTSRSGFISFYDNDPRKWPKFADWDANQLGTLFRAYLLYKEGPDFDEYMEICEDYNSNGDIDNWLFEGCTPELKRLDKIASYLRSREERKWRRPAASSTSEEAVHG